MSLRIKEIEPNGMQRLLFYCTGRGDPAREDDLRYMAEVDNEVADLEATIEAFGPRQTLGIGGAGSDWLQYVSLALTLLNAPKALAEAAAVLRAISEKARRTQHTVWRLGIAAVVIECCEQIRERQGDEYDVDVDAIEVTSVALNAVDLHAVPDAHHLLTIPSPKNNRTYVFLGDQTGGAELLREIPGLPRKR